jgi:hypothetical protein
MERVNNAHPIRIMIAKHSHRSSGQPERAFQRCGWSQECHGVLAAKSEHPAKSCWATFVQNLNLSEVMAISKLREG